MGKWNTTSFIQAWMSGTLGRKRVHGSYRVLVGDHCTLLVRASTKYGRPTGSDLVGINLSIASEKVCFLHEYNTRGFTYHMNKVMDVYNAPKLPRDVLKGDDPALLESGIIDVNGTEALIELGDKPYLLHKKKTDDGVTTLYWYGIAVFDSLSKLDNRVSTIKEAQDQVKDPEGMEQLCSTWWIEKQHAGFKPPELEEQYVKALSSPVNALDYGYILSDCVSGWASAAADEISMIVPNPDLLTEPYDHRARNYIAARDDWNAAVEKFNSRTPVVYEGLSTKKDRYSLVANAGKRHGWIVRSSVGVYITGKVQNKDDWNDAARLDGWYKLHSKINKIKL